MDIAYKIKNSIKQKVFFQDSALMLLGNGLGNGLMLVAGIIVARILGNDLYGQYGLVKTTMFYIASLSTFGLAFSITKYVSTCVSNASTMLKSQCQYLSPAILAKPMLKNQYGQYLLKVIDEMKEEINSRTFAGF